MSSAQEEDQVVTHSLNAFRRFKTASGMNYCAGKDVIELIVKAYTE